METLERTHFFRPHVMLPASVRFPAFGWHPTIEPRRRNHVGHPPEASPASIQELIKS